MLSKRLKKTDRSSFNTVSISHITGILKNIAYNEYIGNLMICYLNESLFVLPISKIVGHIFFIQAVILFEILTLLITFEQRGLELNI